MNSIFETNFSIPTVQIVSNVTAQATKNPEDIKKLLVEQISSKVRWREFIIGTILGLIPATFLFSYYGDDTVRWVQDAPLIAVAVVLLAVILITAVKAYKKRTKAI